MNRNDVDWAGYWPASPTPFTKDGHLDESALRDLMDLYVSSGVHGVLLNGSSGEWFSQSPEERRRVAEIGVEAIAGRVPVVVGTSAYTAAEAAALAQHAEKVGADGALATPPPYVHPDEREILEFYKRVSEATNLPFMAYNWPRGVSVDMAAAPNLMARIAALPQVAAIKDSTGNWNSMVHTVEEVSHQVRVFGSFVHRKGLAILLGLGGDGAIDGGGIGAPFAVPFFEAVQAGNADLARFWIEKYQALSSRLIRADYSGVHASPISQLKAAMSLLGQPGGYVREPLLPVEDPAVMEKLADVLREAGLYVPGARREAAA